MTFNDLISLFRQGKAAAKSHIKNLIEIAAADGNFDHSELDLLKEIGKKHGISERQVSDIRQKSNSIAFVVPQDSKEKFHQLYDLVRMMTIDKSVNPEEQRLCHLFAVKFGYRREHANQLVYAIQSNISNGMDVNETMQKCQMLITT
jgi:uncharacterized tellurite resistance protein B-like protein